MVMPIPAVAQTPAAVVRPLMVWLRTKIMPAPRKPTPVTICAAIREGSSATPLRVVTSEKPYLETTMMSAAASATIRCVRIPASFRRLLRS